LRGKIAIGVDLVALDNVVFDFLTGLGVDLQVADAVP
jgi:hypothetical protein